MTGIAVNLPRVVAADEALAFTNEIGLFVAPYGGTPPTVLTIAGSVSLEATARTGNPFTAGWQITAVIVASSTSSNMRVEIATGGLLRVTSSVTVPDSPAVAVWSGLGEAYVLFNAGAIEVTSQGAAKAVYKGEGGNGLLNVGNTGAIRVVSTDGSAIGLDLTTAHIVNNGTIEVRGATEAIGVRLGASYFGGLVNRGSIVAHSDGPGESVGVFWATDPNGGSFFDNMGRIEGDIALTATAQPFGATSLRFNNAGDLIGRVELAANRDELRNSGRIEGAVNLGAGDDTYDGAEGRASGMVAGGDGADSLAGGAGFDNFQGNAGRDTESGGAGDDWVVGGKDNDLLAGDAGADLVYGNLGADTCDGGDGGDIVRGGQDDDLVRGVAGDDYVSGDRGADTMTGGSGADIFHSFGEAGVDRVTDFSLAEGDRILLDPGTQYTVAQAGVDTVVSMTGGGQVVLIGVSLASLTSGWIADG